MLPEAQALAITGGDRFAAAVLRAVPPGGLVIDADEVSFLASLYHLNVPPWRVGEQLARAGGILAASGIAVEVHEHPEAHYSFHREGTPDA